MTWEVLLPIVPAVPMMCSLPQVVDRLEATLRVKRFNQLGGLQLDRDVRHMVVTLSQASPAMLREHDSLLLCAHVTFDGAYQRISGLHVSLLCQITIMA